MASHSNHELKRSGSENHLSSHRLRTLPSIAVEHPTQLYNAHHHHHPSYRHAPYYYGGAPRLHNQHRSNVYSLLNCADEDLPSPDFTDVESDDDGSPASRSISLPPITSITSGLPSPISSHQSFGLKPVHWPEQKSYLMVASPSLDFQYNGVFADRHVATVLSRIDTSKSIECHTSPYLSPLDHDAEQMQSFPSPINYKERVHIPATPHEDKYSPSVSPSPRPWSASLAPYSPSVSPASSAVSRGASYPGEDSRDEEEDTEWRTHISGTIQHAVCTWPVYKEGCLVPVACGFHSKKHTTKRHIETVHLKIQRWQCAVCNQRFTQKASLNRHQLLHTGEKPFKCNYNCGTTFNDRARKHRHMIEVHDHKPKHHVKQKPHKSARPPKNVRT